MKPVLEEMLLGKKVVSIEGKVVLPESVERRVITISRNKGVLLENGEDEPDLVFEEGLIFPGFIDLHVHAREDVSGDWNHKECYRTAGKAAIAGGVTGFADMPNTPVPLISEDQYMEKSLISRQAGLEVLLYAAIGPNTRPFSFDVPYKLFMGKSIGPIFFSSRKDIRKTLEQYTGRSISFHCEDPLILDTHASKGTHALRRPPEAEIEAVRFALEMIEEFDLKGKLCHISTAGALSLFEKAKHDGLKVTVEATPHHLFLEDNGDGMEFPANLKMGEETNPEEYYQVNPPIRDGKDRKALFDAFTQGKIDFLATDHAPHTLEEKDHGISGMPHLDTFGHCVGLLLDLGVPPEILGRAAAYNPAEFIREFGFLPRGLHQGNLAHFTILTPEPQIIRNDRMFTRCGWSPFAGYEFPWKVACTIHRGRFWKKVE